MNSPAVVPPEQAASRDGPVPAPRRIVLASASPARAAILEAAGVPFTVSPAPIDERAVETPLLSAGVGPADLAEALAEAKAVAASSAAADALVIGADQTLEFEGRRWIKPETIAQARNQLARLSGKEHHLHTAMAAARDGSVVWHHKESATLTMRRLTPSLVDEYLKSVGNAALASVGAYQIEGRGIQLFERIEGDHFAILGLLILPLLAFLRGEGLVR